MTFKPDDELKLQMVDFANAALVNLDYPPAFQHTAEATEHMQYGGKHQGLTLYKLYQPGSPSYMAMLIFREDEKRVVSMKQNLMDLITELVEE